jgi:molecular chaperone DnaK
MLHLETELLRSDLEELIRPLLRETLTAIDRALADAGLQPSDLDRVILVDVTPHSLGIATAMETEMGLIPNIFSTIIPRNTVIPVCRSKLYYTIKDDQRLVRVEVSQGEHVNAEENVPLGSFEVEGLPPKPAGEVSIEVQFSLDLNGILTVTASETSSGRQEQLVVNNASLHRLASHELEHSRSAVASLFASLAEDPGEEEAEEADLEDLPADEV